MLEKGGEKMTVALIFAYVFALVWVCIMFRVIQRLWREGQEEAQCPLSEDIFPPEYDEITIYNNVEGVRTPIKTIRVPRSK